MAGEELDGVGDGGGAGWWRRGRTERRGRSYEPAGVWGRSCARGLPSSSSSSSATATASPAFSARRNFAGFTRRYPTPLAVVLELVFFYLPRAPAARRRRGARLAPRHPPLPPHPQLRDALHAAHPDLVFRLFFPDFLGDAATVAFLVRACSSEGCPLDGLRLQRVRSWAALGRTREQSSDRNASMAAAAARMCHSMALLGWSTPRRSWMS
uniref:Uncharacterized protein n=1 Tax=Oryza rufipogon TaxID=4529 RepID=A0A0E0RCU1_ORYRU